MKTSMSDILIGKSADGRGVVEVLVDCPNFTQVISAVQAYNQVSLPELLPCLASEESPQKLFFLLPEGTSPEPLFPDQGSSKLNSDQCSEFATALVRVSAALNSAGLGLWKTRRELCFRENGRLLVVPSFWVPLLSAESFRGDPTLAPEVRSRAFSELFSPPADVYAIASACYDALADTVPILPNPKLPGEWDNNLSSWDAALDAGLRVKPERRPPSPSEWGQLLPSPPTTLLADTAPGGQEREYLGEQVAPRNKTRLKPLLLCILVAAGLYGAWHFRHVISASPSEIKRAIAPDYQRGFGPYVVRYSKRDYGNASWKVIYSYERLPLPAVFFRTITGWDKHNLLVLGGSDDPKSRFLQIKMADGKWSYSGFDMEGWYADYQALFLDKNTFLVSRQGRSGSGLTLNTPAGIEQLEKGGFPRGCLYATDRDSFYCNCKHGVDFDALYYTEHRIEQVEVRKQFILNENNEPVKWSAKYDGGMEVARIAFVNTLHPGQAVGLWQFTKSFVPPAAALVRYRNGFWYLTQRLDLEPRTIHAAWFLDDLTCITAGNCEILVINGDKVHKKRVVISGQDLTNQNFYRVWGSSLEDFCVLDMKGNVYHFAAGTWKLAVRGPDLKNDKSTSDADSAMERHEFDHYWISPDGAIFGLRKKEIYKLD